MTIAVISFPGMNCETEALRALLRNDMEAFFFRWNDSREKLLNADGYLLPGGFSYEDRGRAGMVAGRDSLVQFLAEQSRKGKPIIGICNGAQILVESGLIPLDRELHMALAHNHVSDGACPELCRRGFRISDFRNSWVWITPTCAKDRCAVSNWDGPMHIPIAHGEGRWTTQDRDVTEELRRNNQIAFSYCDESGNTEKGNPNGSLWNIAGICNPAGNVVALMPHPERTTNGDPFFLSLKKWIKKQKAGSRKLEAMNLPLTRPNGMAERAAYRLPPTSVHPSHITHKFSPEIFIDTLITNNEERTVEKVGKCVVPTVRLKQLRYLTVEDPRTILTNISRFNPHKEKAFIRRGNRIAVWNSKTQQEEPAQNHPLHGTCFLRQEYGGNSSEGICYVCQAEDMHQLKQPAFLEILHNPHAHTLQCLSAS